MRRRMDTDSYKEAGETEYMRIAIDLLWLRPGKVGGTEVYTRNLLDGFARSTEKFEFVLLVSQDNAETFVKYAKDSRFTLLEAKVTSANIAGRIIWQNIFESSFLRKNGLLKCFVPVYCRPMFNGGVMYINTLHDIQAYHYPEYHPFHENVYSRLDWWAIAHFTEHIITISRFVKDDFQKYYHVDPERITVLSEAVEVQEDKVADFALVEEKYGIQRQMYFYTVSQCIPHKNFKTLIEVFRTIRDNHIDLPCKLLVSGISGNASKEMTDLIRQYRLEENVIMTGYVADNVRDCLYKNARAYLFPSVFEGFGISPVEAMFYGVPVITTKCASIPEVTRDKAEYVNDPYSVDEWIEKMKNPVIRYQRADLDCYNSDAVAGRYLEYIQKVTAENVNEKI